jgi:arylsulfatase A-like enzyme
VRVPLLLCGPGIAPGTVGHQMAYSLDLYATLAALAGLSVPAGLDSRNLLDGAGLPLTKGRNSIFALYKDVQRMVCDGRWKLIRYRVKGSERLQLFDLERDCDEVTDLSPDPRCGDLVEDLLHQLADWQRAVGDRWMPLETAIAPTLYP